MPQDYPRRRRSPQWVRAMTDKELHGIAFRFSRERQEADLSSRQEWLWDAVISELEWRWEKGIGRMDQCSCEFCCPPFPF